ncbi:DnaJ domain-containing protein [Phototrophicus methaneseepsis]|uniref:DnaJ domain-containing protein n=1 Tax=Phototrophicus methaneseepsis TaxID=2710758 RepID=A0A7S8E8R2_9CHLR|nr:DnaJ C-terminal domain-containing protein [Phototrophicus methaneseepsis]QPC82446.1 DnaJ domain-containing protein [Phototrophicus methaneseepsis]
MPKDYYSILGVSKNADQSEIKRAFRKKAKQYHPDANPDDPQAEDRFKELNEAYEVLSDETKRQQYDQYGANWDRFAGAGGTGGGTYQNVSQEDLQDILNSFFGNSSGGRAGGRSTGFSGFSGFNPFGGGAADYRTAQPTKGQDIEHPITITLEDAYYGKEIVLTVDGRRLNTKIPAGARTGSKIRLSGEGQPGVMGGASGDLYLIIDVAPHPQFEREGDDLITDVEVDAFTAMLGGKAEVRTMTGTGKLTIPPGTQSGQRFRLSGKGMPILRKKGHNGDLYARVVITVPINLTDDQKQQLEAIRNSLT